MILRLRLSDFVDDLETTDRSAACAKAAARRTDVATMAEVQAVRVVTVRRSRPIVAEVAETAETAIVAARTRSRIPNGGCRTELAGKVHALVGAAVGVVEG